MMPGSIQHDTVSPDDFRRAVTEAPVPVLLAFAGGGEDGLSALLDPLARRFDGRVRVGTIIAQDNPQLCRRLGIVVPPVLVLFRHSVETARRAGKPVSEIDLADWLQPLIADICGCDRCR